MSWLTPMTAIIASAVAGPLLVLLYFLKLRRREVSISCTLFWKRAVQDLQVNAPFQRLRRNILLLLQLLALAAILAGLGSPMLNWRGGSGKRYVILIDQSASMGAMDVEPSRLAAAKRQARDFVGTLRQETFLGGLGGSDQAMVIAFAAEPQVLCAFTSKHRDLLAAIDSIEQTDGPSRLAEAVKIARAFATPTDPDAAERSGIAPAKLVLFTDGRIADRDRIVLREDEMIVHQIGQSSKNIAITAMQARRSYEDPEELSVFAQVANYSDRPVDCDVQLSLNGKVIGVEGSDIPPANRAPGQTEPQPGRSGVVFKLRSPETGVLEIRQLTDDLLSTDDAARVILARAKRASALLVTAGNLVLEDALRSLPLAKVETMTREEFDKVDRGEFETTRPFDLIILDRSVPKDLPRCSYVVFGPPPSLKGLTAAGPKEDQFILDWRVNHPVLRFVDLANVFAKKWWQLDLPDDAHVLAEGDHGAVIAIVSRRGSSFLMVNFDVLDSNWPFHPSFVMFLYNATRFFATQGGGADVSSLAVGSSLTVQVPPQITNIRVIHPDGRSVTRSPDAAGTMRYANLDRVGIYRVERDDGKGEVFAVNLLDPGESNIGPPEQIRFGGEKIASKREGVKRANLDLRPLLVFLALVILGLEWFIYNKKVQI